MKYTVVSSSEFTYPDIWSYDSSTDKADIGAARGGYATCQILVGDMTDPTLPVSIAGLPDGVTPEIYTLRAVPVEANPGISEEHRGPHYPEREAPYWLYDCLCTYKGTVELTDGVGGIYLALKVEKDAVPGVYPLTVNVGACAIPATLQIYAAVLPEETLDIMQGFDGGAVCKFHGVEWKSPEYYELEQKYLRCMRRMHQNIKRCGGVTYKKVDETTFEFDFSGLIEEIRRYRKAGFTKIKAPAVGWRKHHAESTIYLFGEIPSMTYEGYCFLTQYLPQLKAVLEAEGVLEGVTMSVADEPNANSATEFRALCGLIHRIAPEIKLADALSYGNIHGALDVWIPLNSHYEMFQDKWESFRAAGGELWHYVCCGPRNPGYINRFMDYPLLSTRYLHWGNYRHNLSGYLHWAVNCYQPGQNPFESNCPVHTNVGQTIVLPAGDSHIIYPGDDGPWISIRLEAERESAEEYELLKKLAETDKTLADEICETVYRSFKDVEYDVNLFDATRRRLLEAVSAIQ